MRAGRDEGGSHICATRTMLVARRGPCGLRVRAALCGASAKKGRRETILLRYGSSRRKRMWRKPHWWP